MHVLPPRPAYGARVRTIRCHPQRSVRRFHTTPIPRQPADPASNGVPQSSSGSSRTDEDRRAISEEAIREKSVDDHGRHESRSGGIAEKSGTLSKEADEINAPAHTAAKARVAELRDNLRQVRQEAVDCASQLDRIHKRLRKLSRRGGAFPAEEQIIELPKWFIERNVILHEELKKALSSSPSDRKGFGLLWDDHHLFKKEVPQRYVELFSYFAGSFAVAEARGQQLFPNFKSHLALYCMHDDSLEQMTSLVRFFAAQLDADFIGLDAQDLAELASECLVSDTAWSQSNIHTLGYDTYDRDGYSEDAEGETEIEDADAHDSIETAPKTKGFVILKDLAIPKDISSSITNLLQTSGLLPQDVRNGKKVSTGGPPIGTGSFAPSPHVGESLGALLEAVIDASRIKRLRAEPNIEVEFQTRQPGLSELMEEYFPDNLRRTLTRIFDPLAKEEEPQEEFGHASNNCLVEKVERRTVIFLRDFMDLSASPTGLRVITFLEDIVQQRRNAGEQIILVGATDSLELEDESPEEAQRRLNFESEASRFRALLLPLQESAVSRFSRKPKEIAGRKVAMDAEAWRTSSDLRRNVEINYRNIGHMLSQLYPGRIGFDRFSPSAKNWNYVANRVLRQDEVQCIALATIGLQCLQSRLGAASDGALIEEHIAAALELLDRIYAWEERLAQELEKEKDAGRAKLEPGSERENRIASIRENANRYEKRLLNAVVPPKKIRITFDDVHVAQETIEALKTLTSLSLKRPEAFKYGVLKTDTIPGLLLYGPPGTGKTMLAKAVAKESGATVLNVSGSDVNQMYVGESEKVVKAIFSLARKLSPCVVFIDEADSIFAARSQSRQRSGHRDTINQFLQEWDGIEDINVFLMVATNRPFDLDDAVLRRLPRRLLVDLPQKDDREAILRIHLKDEALDPSISLSTLAESTPFYSGSDLKNLAVAAALAAVRNENDCKARFADYTYPEKRVLTKEHFDKAMQEISASVSEDMKSLNAIRKFDEEFGSGNRRKKAAWGFVPAQSGESSVRVRP